MQRATAMRVTRRKLFESDQLQLGLVDTQGDSTACGDVERQSSNVVVLVQRGVFAKHDRPGHHVVGTPNHAVFVAADTPYRLSLPGAIGDRALVMRFDSGLAPSHIERQRGADALRSSGLLPARALLLRCWLWRRLELRACDPLEIEASSLELLELALGAMRARTPSPHHTTHMRHAHAVQRVKEAVAVAPAHRWTVAKLAAQAGLSPFYLCRVFREQIGTSIYDYVLQERLAYALPMVLDAVDLASIAHEAGFSSHSHFTARFRRHFGCAPASLRRSTAAERSATFRKIMTARRGEAP